VASSATPGELRKNAASPRAAAASAARITSVCQSTITSVPVSRNPPAIGRGKRRARASNTLISTVVSSNATPAVATSEVTGDTLPSGRITRR
jgi:hypothetical protein